MNLLQSNSVRFFLFCLILILPAVSHGVQITVDSALDDNGAGTLREAIAAANPAGGDEIIFNLPPGTTITLTMGEIPIDESLTITGPGADMLTISGNNASRIFNINDGDNGNRIEVSISGLTFTNGSADTGGAIYNKETITEIADCVFSGNFAASFGGAIENFPGAIIENITDCTFSGNSSGIDAGAVDNYRATIKNITNCTFIGNSATASNNPTGGYGGAIDNYEGTIENITYSTFSGNSAARNPGAIRAIAFGSRTSTIENITNCTFSGNSSGTNGGAIVIVPEGNDSTATVNISFTTIANNEAGGNGGGINVVPDVVGAAFVNIRNSIVAFNTAGGSGDNCFIDVSGTIEDKGNNYSNNSDCGFTGDASIILLGPLADNGGPTETLALLGGAPVNGASADCEPLGSDGMPTGVLLPNDQRNFPRPFDTQCDAGAYELGPSSVKITKLTIPSGGSGFSFTSIGFGGFPDCDITPAFILDDMQMASCIVPIGDYTITEDIPDDQVVAIICEELPEGSMIDSLNGTLSFTIDEEGDNVDCLFINSPANIVLRATVEPPGPNCEFGGQIIESGPDINQNSVLDDDEVDPNLTFFVCNGAPGAPGPGGPQGPQGPPGDDGMGLTTLTDINLEPPGPNCTNGGFRFDVGLDLDMDGILDPEEITETSYACNGAPGADGDDGSNNGCNGSSLAGANSASATLGGLLFYALIPAAVLLRRRIRKNETKK